MTRRADARFGARAVFAGAALLLVAVPFGLLLFLVEDSWRPLVRMDGGARDDLHAVALRHDGLVSALKVLSTIGSAVVYIPLFAAVAAWLVWSQRLPRLAAFVVVTMAGSSLLNALVKLAVDRARPVLADPVAHAGGMSFPSGHAQSAMVAASVLLLVFLPLLHGAWRWVAVARRGRVRAGDRLRARHARRALRLRRPRGLRARRRLGGGDDRRVQRVAARARAAGGRSGARASSRGCAPLRNATRTQARETGARCHRGRRPGSPAGLGCSGSGCSRPAGGSRACRLRRRPLHVRARGRVLGRGGAGREPPPGQRDRLAVPRRGRRDRARDAGGLVRRRLGRRRLRRLAAARGAGGLVRDALRGSRSSSSPARSCCCCSPTGICCRRGGGGSPGARARGSRASSSPPASPPGRSRTSRPSTTRSASTPL